MTDTKKDDHGDLLCVFKESKCVSTFTLNEGGQWTTEGRRQIKTKKRKSNWVRGSSIRTMILHFLWSSRRTFVLNAILCNITFSLFISLFALDEASCDDNAMQYQRPDLYESSQEQRPGLNLGDGQDQRQQAHQFDLASLFGNQMQQEQQRVPMSDVESPIGQSSRSSSTNELAFMTNMLDQLSNQRDFDQENRESSSYQSTASDADMLETAQTKAETNSVSSTSSESSEKSPGGASTSSPGASAPASTSTAISSQPGSLSEQLSAVSNLIQQAGQLGLNAAQNNVALSEAIINGVANTFIRNNQSRRPSASNPTAQISAHGSTRPGHVVGQSIDGNIEFDSNSNTINGSFEFPNFPNFPSFNGNSGLNAAVKPLLLAGLKVVPLKLGAIGWKLLQLLAWKKIYKTHHPKSGEIIIEQEMGKHSHGMSDKGGKLGGKISQHFGNKLKTSKMGQSYVNDDWMSMMKSTGGMHGGDMFSSGGWPQASSESPSASASMIYQRHLLPPSFPAPGGQPAAAAAAAAAATAAAIQSHWIQQQSLMSEEGTATAESQQSRSNSTSLAPGSAASALKRKKASFAGGNWFAATPAQAYLAAAAAANTAANLAASQQQQHRMAHIMRAFELGANPDYLQMFGSGPVGYGNGGNGLSYHQSLFDNAAAMAVQNAVKLPSSDAPNPLASAEFLDQSDSLSGSSFGSPFSSMTNSINDQPEPMTLMQRHDTGTSRANHFFTDRQNFWSAHSPGFRSSTDSLFNEVSRNEQRTDSILNEMADFDDTPAGKLLHGAMNGSESSPLYRVAQDHQRSDK